MVVRKLSGELKEDSRIHIFQGKILVDEGVFEGGGQVFEGLGVVNKTKSDGRTPGDTKTLTKFEILDFLKVKMFVSKMSAKMSAKMSGKMSGRSWGSETFRRIEGRFQNTHFSRANFGR